MKEVEIIDKGNTVHKLTVTPTRISIKYKKDTTKEEREKVYAFFMKVANSDGMVNCTQSWRGQLRKELSFTICMSTDSGNQTMIF